MPMLVVAAGGQLTNNTTSPPIPFFENTQWDKVENKTGVVIYGAGAIVALWLSSTVIGAINAVPLVRCNRAVHGACMELHGACMEPAWRAHALPSEAMQLHAHLELRSTLPASLWLDLSPEF